MNGGEGETEGQRNKGQNRGLWERQTGRNKELRDIKEDCGKEGTTVETSNRGTEQDCGKTGT